MIGLIWEIRRRLPVRARRAARRAADFLLSVPLGSVCGARATERVVALTFDDGPDNVTTPAVLDLLAKHHVSATFFLMADRAESCPAIVRRMVDEGHEIGLHGVDHRPPGSISAGELPGWMEEGRRRLESVAARSVWLFRPPSGSQTLRSYIAARRAGLKVVVWSAHAADWEEGTPQEVARRGLAGVTPGGILLLHDAFEPDPRRPTPGPVLDRGAVVELLLAGLEARGYRPETVSRLLHGRRPLQTAWFRP
jgi:peptidoglycan/xylan/chitin deacetylase (PgdA/CDA1 family)